MNNSPVPVPPVNPDFRILDIAQVAVRCGVTPETIQHWLKHERFPRPMRHARLICQRLRTGWSVERTLTTPLKIIKRF